MGVQTHALHWRSPRRAAESAAMLLLELCALPKLRVEHASLAGITSAKGRTLCIGENRQRRGSIQILFSANGKFCRSPLGNENLLG